MESSRDEDRAQRALDSALNQLNGGTRMSRMSQDSWGGRSQASNDSGYRTPPQKAWIKAVENNKNMNNGHVQGAGGGASGKNGSQACVIL